MKVLIVESPTKAKTLKRFLKGDIRVVSSMGHIRDLPKSDLGVDVDKDYKPKYVTLKGKQKIISEIKKAIKHADEIYIATDLDREGEAIGWHVLQAVGIKESKKKRSKSKTPIIRRIVFHEITRDAVDEALAHPRDIDKKLVDAQQARRILDRLVGYNLSPLLWKKVKYGLSAGRVQSVAVRLIVDRERERENFVADEYWTLEAFLAKHLSISTKEKNKFKKLETSLLKDNLPKGVFKATLIEHNGKNVEIKDEKKARGILRDLEEAFYRVDDIKESEKRRNPYPPFVTATLQRAGVNVLGFTSKRTMRAAQNLYEAGFITYMRTDSVHLAKSAIKQVRSFIKEKFGHEYLPKVAVRYRTKAKSAQEAHEAIRPTHIRRSPADAGVIKLGRDEARLYDLIYKRTLACQMLPAVYDLLSVDIKAGKYLFRAIGRTLRFEGWLKVWNKNAKDRDTANSSDNQESDKTVLPDLSIGEELELLRLEPLQHFTQPPPRYTEATLIKELEKEGIGRPSTYAPIISTIQARGYVNKDGKYFSPEDVGKVVTDLLVTHFPNIVATKFTAQMEEDLDQVATGKKDWVPVIREFYEPFAKILEKKLEELKKEDFTELGKTSDKCPECKKPMVIKLGRFGKFLSCSGFPECRHREPYVEAEKDTKSTSGGKSGETKNQVDRSQLEGSCPECKSELILKEGRFGKFVACSNYPKCKFTKNYLDKIVMKCPQCKRGEVIRKRTRRGKLFFGCSNYPECKYGSWTDPRGGQTS